MNLLKKLFSFSIGSLIAIIIGIISIPIITRVISPSEYGIAILFITIGTVISTFAIGGLDQAFVRFFYETNRRKLVLQCVVFTSIITTIIIFFLFFFNYEISSFISKENEYATYMSFYIVSIILFRFSALILRMMQFGYRYSIIQGMQKLFDFIFIISIAFLFHPNHFAVILGSIITLLLLTIVSLIVSLTFWKTSEQNYTNIKNSILISYSLPLMLSGLMTILFQTIDKLLLNYWVDSIELGIYAAGFKLVAILNIIQSSFTLFWAPVSLEHYKNHPEDKAFYGKVSKIITVIMLSACILVVMTKNIVVFILGPEYHEAATVIAVLVLMPVMYTMSETTIQGVNFSLKTYLHIYISGISLLTNISLSLILIPCIGMKGAAISVGLSYVVFYFARTYFGLIYFKFDIKLKEIVFIIFLLVAWILLVMFIESNILLFIGGISLLVLIYILFKQEILEGKLFFHNIFKERRYRQ